MKSPTIDTYERYHDVYDNETKDFWRNFPPATINFFVKHLKGKKVLDMGSGPGRDALLLKEAGLEVICLDASKEMVKRTEKLGFKSILADFRKMPFSKQEFDGVWAYTSLLHIKKKEMAKVIREIRTLLKPNGLFVIGMIEGDFDGNVERESMPNTKRHFSFYTEEELKNILNKCGFNFEFQNKYTPRSKTYLNQVYSVAS